MKLSKYSNVCILACRRRGCHALDYVGFLGLFLGIILAAYLVDRLGSRKYNLEHKKTMNQVAAQANSDREVDRYNNQSF